MGILVMRFAMNKPVQAATELSEQAQKLLAGFTWFKQSGFRIQDADKVLYFDPYQLTETTHDADWIFISHSHSDHCDPGSVQKIYQSTTRLITEPESAAKMNQIVADITIVAPGDSISLEGRKIELVPSYNLVKTNHPKSKNYLGFIVTLSDGRRVYQAGDTDKIPEMATIDTDIALLPCGGTFTMTASEAAEAAQMIQPKIVVPMHYGSAVGSVRDAEKVKELLLDSIEVVILDPGQTVPITTRVSNWTISY